MQEPNGEMYVVEASALLELLPPQANRWKNLVGQQIHHRNLGCGRVQEISERIGGGLYLKVLFPDESRAREFSTLKFAEYFSHFSVVEAVRLDPLIGSIVLSQSEHDRLTAFRHEELAKEKKALLDQVQKEVQRVEQEARINKEIILLRKKFHARDTSPPHPASRLFRILKQLTTDASLSEEDIEYLRSEDEYGPLAAYYERQFELTSNPRLAIKACAYWRNAGVPQGTIRLSRIVLNTHPISEVPINVVAQALTTRGAAFADMGRLNDAKNCALRALKWQRSYYPHNLLGRI